MVRNLVFQLTHGVRERERLWREGPRGVRRVQVGSSMTNEVSSVQDQ